MGGIVLIGMKQLVEIVTDPQKHPFAPGCLIRRQEKAGQRLCRAMFDGEGVREPKVVCGDDVRIHKRHRSRPTPFTSPNRVVWLTKCYSLMQAEGKHNLAVTWISV